MLCQLGADDTLVPPNLSTTQEVVLKGLFVFEDVAELFFQLPLGQDVLDAAPGSFATFARGHRFGPAFCTLYDVVEVVRLLGFTEKLIVDVEMFVFAFAHGSRKAPEINGIDCLVLGVAHYSGFCIAFNYEHGLRSAQNGVSGPGTGFSRGGEPAPPLGQVPVRAVSA